MDEIKLNLSLLSDRFVICRLSPDAEIPEQLTSAQFVSITRTAEELSIVCTEQNAPGDAKSDWGWRCFKIKGPLDFSLIGIIASISTTLAQVGVSIFTIST